MQAPSIEHHSFAGSLRRSQRGALWAFWLALFPLTLLSAWDDFEATILSGRITGSLPLDMTLGVLVLGTFCGLTFWLLWWLFLGRRYPALVIGPDGLHDRLRWRAAIPWSRIVRVRPTPINPASYEAFEVEIEGPNVYSRRAFVRWFDNWIARPLGGTTFFTVSLRNLAIEDAEAADLIRRIVAAAPAPPQPKGGGN